MAKKSRRQQAHQNNQQPIPNGQSGVTPRAPKVPKLDRQEVVDNSAALRHSSDLSTAAAKALPNADEVKAMPETVLVEFKARLEILDQGIAEIQRHRQAAAELEKDRRELEIQRNQQDEREKTIVEQESSLALREADARNGFLAQNRAALEKLHEQISRLEAERDDLVKQGEEARREARAAIDRDWAAFRAEQDQARESLAKKQRELEEQQRELQWDRDQLEQARRNQAALKDRIERDLEARYHRENMDLKHRNQRLVESGGRDESKIQEQQRALDAWEDLQAEVRRQGLSGPRELLEQLDELRDANRNLQEEVSRRPADDLEQRYEDLQDRFDDQARLLEDRQREIESLRSQLTVNRLGVLERQTLEQEKRVLEQHKRALDSAVDDLQKRLDDLIQRQQGSEVFPALAKMDRELNRPIPTVDVPSLNEFAEQLRHRIATATEIELYYSEEVIRLFLGGLAMSQLHILQGISGTGKTSLAKAFAEAVGGRCTLVPVQAGWRDRDDLLGHFNAFERRFYERECLQAVYRASTEACSSLINVVLLDEMNLSHPEQYFAEFLSVMEPSNRKDGVRLMETAPGNPPAKLREGRFLQIPDNLWFIGTANQDETTKGFADKTIDRAHVMELPRNDQPFQLQRLDKNLPFSVESLHKRFREAQNSHRQSVDAALKAIQGSDFSRLLERTFNLGWGNRLEQQARRFVPVVMEAGGTPGEAFDHLLATRLFRQGKIIGSYDVKSDALQDLQGRLEDLWSKVDPQDPPVQCIQRLEREIERKGQQW